MAMVNMKVLAKEQKTDLETSPGPETYPYGLQITLGPQALQKLGMNPTEFKVNQRLALFCEVEIMEIRGVDIQRVEPQANDPSIMLQITDLDVSSQRRSEGDRFQEFYKQHTAGPGGDVGE